MGSLRLDPVLLLEDRRDEIVRLGRELAQLLSVNGIVFVGARGRPLPWLEDPPGPEERRRARIVLAAIACARAVHWPAAFFGDRKPSATEIDAGAYEIEIAMRGRLVWTPKQRVRLAAESKAQSPT